MTKLTEAQIAEIQSVRDTVAANKTGWVEIKPAWFQSNDDFVRYLCERNQKRRLEILDSLLDAGRAALNESAPDRGAP